MNTPAQQVTAAQIAAEIGKLPQAVRRCLANVRADGEPQRVRGNPTKCWKIESLPAPLWKELESTRLARGLNSVAELFTQREAWQPEIPWRDADNEQQLDALKLQRALLPVLERHRHPILDNGELVEIGLRNYKLEFGKEISPERWKYLFNRTLDRDSNRFQFKRPEIYLPGNLRRAAKDNAPRSSPEPDGEFHHLYDLVRNFGDRANPTAAEKSLFGMRVFEFLKPLLDSRKEFKATRLRLLDFLWQYAGGLSKSKNALRVALDRALATGIVSGGAADAFADGREDRRGVPVLPPYDPEQIKLAKVSAADCTGGHVVTALRELNEAGQITDPRIKHHLDTAGSKSYLPASLRAEFKDVEAWRIIAKGQRYAHKMTPPRKLTYDGIFSMTCLVGDDKTFDVYTGVPDGHDWWDPIRPQFIPIIDFRSDFIIGWSLVPFPQYKVMDFYVPYKRIFKKFGLPQFILREGGMWRESHLANSLADIGKGTKERNLKRFSPGDIEFGLERRGVTFMDSFKQLEEKFGDAAIKFRESYQPRSKPVEGTIRLLTQYMERLPCYSGRDERYDCPQATRDAVDAVKKRKAAPHEVGMLYWDQMVEAVKGMVAKHNSSKQEGRRLRNPLTGAPMSPEEAFEVFQNLDNPPVAFDAQCEVLLSHVQCEVTVRAPNLRRKQFPCGFVELRGNTYCDEQTGARIGQKLLAHWDPEFPESCTFTDMKLRNPFTVPRLEPNNALLPDPQMAITTAQAQRTINVVRAEYHATKAKFAPVLRQTFVAPLVKELNAHTKAQTQAIVERKQTESRRRSKVTSRARKLGLPSALVRNADDATAEGLEMMARAERAMDEAGDTRKGDS